MIRHAESGARVLRSVCHKLNSGWSAGIALVVVFVVTRILILQSAVTCPVDGDIQYYAGSFALSAASGTSPLKEYPTPVVWILEAIYRLGGGDGWAPVYVACFMALDALVALSLFRRRNAAGAWFWILFTGALGSTLYFRYDLIPAALVAWACLLVISHPAVAGGLLALGAAVKLWPALLMAPMLTPLRRRGAGWLRLAGFVVVGVAMVVAALLFGGWKRLLTPLTYQTDRGLQIESLPATLPMLLRAVDPSGGWEVGLSSSTPTRSRAGACAPCSASPMRSRP